MPGVRFEPRGALTELATLLIASDDAEALRGRIVPAHDAGLRDIDVDVQENSAVAESLPPALIRINRKYKIPDMSPRLIGVQA